LDGEACRVGTKEFLDRTPRGFGETLAELNDQLRVAGSQSRDALLQIDPGLRYRESEMTSDQVSERRELESSETDVVGTALRAESVQVEAEQAEHDLFENEKDDVH
jgi:hypothetical protein